MSALVDTCGWIEWLVNGTLAECFAPALSDPAALLVPTLVQYELHRWIVRERDEATALEVIAVSEQGLVVPLDTPLALLASEFSGRHRLAMADAVIYATAQHHGVALLSLDAHFKGLPGVRYFGRGKGEIKRS